MGFISYLEKGKGIQIRRRFYTHGLDITLLELAALSSKGRIRLEISLESFLEEIEARFIVLPISGRACARALGLPATYPKDPADRIIGATALVEGMSLLTADQRSDVRGLSTEFGKKLRE